jgi:tetratricopeptide (TPR) repeat protein
MAANGRYSKLKEDERIGDEKGGREMKTKIIRGKVVAEPTKAKEIIAIAPEEVQNHLEWGKALLNGGQFEEARAEFETVLRTAPGSIETRVLMRQVKEALARPEAAVAAGAEAVAEAVKPKECVWMKLGMVSYRVCTNDYDCLSCEFDQAMQEKMAQGTAELDAALEKFKELPGSQRVCRYALKGDISYRLCTRLFQCSTCEFGQNMEEAIERKLEKLAARREALRKKTA